MAVQSVLYIVQVHGNLPGFQFLMSLIFNESDSFVLIIDAKASEDLKSWAKAFEASNPNVVVHDQALMSWGGFSLVESVVDALTMSLDRDNRWSHAIMLSGDHLPLCQPDAVRAALSIGTSYIPSWPVNLYAGDPRSKDVKSRVEWSYKEVPGIGCFAVRKIDVNPMLAASIHAGSNWMCISRSHCEYLTQKRSLVRVFSETVMSDEVCLQTLLSLGASQKVSNIECKNLTFVSSPWVGGTPDMRITTEQFFAAIDKFLFVRKRPDILPEKITDFYSTWSTHLAFKSFSKQRPILPGASAMLESYHERLVTGLKSVFSKSQIQSYGGSGVLSPRLYLKVTGGELGSSSFLAIMSEDLLHFKIVNGFHDVFDGQYEAGSERDKYSSVLRARVHGLHHHREIINKSGNEHSFLSVHNSSDLDRVLISAMAGVSPVAS